MQLLQLAQEKLEEQKMKEAAAREKFEQSSFGKRLQSENPFVDFKKAVEKAVLDKTKHQQFEFEGDKDFYRDTDDFGMTITLNQPWASLITHGFKRFQGCDWTSKFRGPLWIHSSARKPTENEISAAESYYEEFYKEIGNNLPSFPDRYILSSLLGRTDLVDIIQETEYDDAVPKGLKEQVEGQYVMVLRNPMHLDIPIKMNSRGD